MIPKLNNNGELPEGEHLASLDEIEDVYGLANDCRKKLMAGLREAAINYSNAGVTRLWINGSFIADKKEPSDIDGCWEYNNNVHTDSLEKHCLFGGPKTKEIYGLDFYIANITELGSGLPFPQFFQKNREGNSKGIIVVELGAMK